MISDTLHDLKRLEWIWIYFHFPNHSFRFQIRTPDSKMDSTHDTTELPKEEIERITNAVHADKKRFEIELNDLRRGVKDVLQRAIICTQIAKAIPVDRKVSSDLAQLMDKLAQVGCMSNEIWHDFQKTKDEFFANEIRDRLKRRLEFVSDLKSTAKTFHEIMKKWNPASEPTPGTAKPLFVSTSKASSSTETTPAIWNPSSTK